MEHASRAPLPPAASDAAATAARSHAACSRRDCAAARRMRSAVARVRCLVPSVRPTQKGFDARPKLRRQAGESANGRAPRRAPPRRFQTPGTGALRFYRPGTARRGAASRAARCGRAGGAHRRSAQRGVITGERAPRAPRPLWRAFCSRARRAPTVPAARATRGSEQSAVAAARRRRMPQRLCDAVRTPAPRQPFATRQTLFVVPIGRTQSSLAPSVRCPRRGEARPRKTPHRTAPHT
jgi:hypothetical protein